MLSKIITYISIIGVSYITGIRIYETIIVIHNNLILIINYFTIPIMTSFLYYPIHYLLSNICLPFFNTKYILSNSKYYSVYNRYNIDNKALIFP